MCMKLVVACKNAAPREVTVHVTSGYQQVFSKPCLVNFISKDTHLVFSIYIYIYCS